ncbi:hypothetical protein RIF29_08938 [Crotalaria pallida]|uniref:Clp R domain-containing protein n=1 Tax=Crotalaria pallida TaxID=3830 RepID=A0AAN9IHM0_CROPI
MRSGAFTLQQTLTAEAASVLKHSLVLARRRGHAQVTPLHVAATLLSLRASSDFRRACLKSQPQYQTSSHPLQCRALELCFNVALNRLPTTPSAPNNLLHTFQPCLSNALIAALKRAQAHQRRGCIEQQQQQPLLTIKVELEQLIISILDDPSVSRVMREAGFSSIAVKNNFEDNNNTSTTTLTSSVFYNSSCGSGGGVFSSPCSPSENQRKQHFFGAYTNSHEYSTQKKVFPITHEEDVKMVLDVLLRKKRKNIVIIGDSLSLTEGLVGEIMGKFERGEVHDELKSTHFIKFQFASLRFMNKDEVEMNLSALKRKVDCVKLEGKGAIIYVGDLKWTVEAISSIGLNEKDGGGYNPVDHVVEEIGKLFCEQGNSNTTKVCLMGTASYQTYMRCQMRQPPLEAQWGLQAVPVSSGGLGLSLNASSVHDSKMSNISQNPSKMMETKLFSIKEENDKLNCCEECASNYEKEAQLFKPGQKKLLPSWLQSHSTEAHQKNEITQLKRKWNRLCYCLHQSKQLQSHWNISLYGNNHNSNAKIYPYNSSYPWWPNQTSVLPDSSSISFADSAAAKPVHSSNLVPRFRRQQSCSTIEFNFSNDVTERKQSTLDSVKDVKITLALGNSTFNGGSREKVENISDTTTLVQQAHICKLLQENVPWQSETVPSIAKALVLGCSKSSKEKSDTWLFMHGNDSVGKTRLARAIAESVFGSVDDGKFLHMDMIIKKGEISSGTTPFSEMLDGALKTHEQLVILIENVDSADARFMKFLADEFEKSKFGNLCSNEENPCQAIFILSNGVGTRRSNDEEHNKDFVMRLVLQVSETKPTLESSSSSSPCLGHKRNNIQELDLFTKIKKARIEEKEEEESVSVCERKKEVSRQSSFNTLDLNIKACDDEEEEYEENIARESSPISSDLTREFEADNLNSNNGFVNSIENRFEFNQSPAREKEMEEMFLSKIKGSFEEVCGKQCMVNFSVQDKVIEEIGVRCGSFTNSMFEKWLKDIFQSSVKTVNLGGKEKDKEGIVFTLCWGGKGDTKLDSGFMSSCLPKNIQVNYFMD